MEYGLTFLEAVEALDNNKCEKIESECYGGKACCFKDGAMARAFKPVLCPEAIKGKWRLVGKKSIC